MPQFNEFSWMIFSMKFSVIFLIFFMVVTFSRLSSVLNFSHFYLIKFSMFI